MTQGTRCIPSSRKSKASFRKPAKPQNGPAFARGENAEHAYEVFLAELVWDPQGVTAEMIRDHLLGRRTLNAAELQACDVNGDGVVDAADLVALIGRAE